jgi:phosphate transport system substrate-binding protein
MSRNTLFVATASFLAAVCLLRCPSCEASGSDPGKSVSLEGAGATFPYPLYSKWVFEYGRIHPNIRINYQSIGSGGGIRQITEGTVDFGGSDAFMKDEALAQVKGKLLHIPTTLGAVVITYNLPNALSHLKLGPEAIAGIFIGEITRWNDPRIAALNPGLKLPDTPIGVVHRSDGSGTTSVFTDYLSKVSPAWAQKVGSGTSVSWPIGLGAKGNEGVTGQVKSTPGSVGYVELVYAKQNGLPYASVRNSSGSFVEPALEGVSAAAASVKVPADFRVSITDAPGDKAYPISAFTWILIYQDQKDAAKGTALVDFLWWAIHDGQKLGGALGYAPLPAELVGRIEATLQTVTAGGKPARSK